MGDLWTWIGAIKGEAWGTFAGVLVVFVIKGVGPMLQRTITTRFLKAARELEALAAREEEVSQNTSQNAHVRQLEIELGLARKYLKEAGEDQQTLANRISQLESERESWKSRCEAYASENEELRKLLNIDMAKGKKNAAADPRRPIGAGHHAKPAGAVERGPLRTDHVPTVPPSGRGRVPPK